MNFLETITWMDSDVLVPISRIKHITLTCADGGWKIKIKSDDGEWEENFGDDDKKAKARYKMIMSIVDAK